MQGVSNPYPYACSRLCNHPVDSEARREYRETVRKGGKDTDDIRFFVNGEEKSQQEEIPQQPVPRSVILDSVPAVVEAVMPSLAAAAASRSEGAAAARQRSSRRRNLEVRLKGIYCPLLQTAPYFTLSVWHREQRSPLVVIPIRAQPAYWFNILM